ncbi:MAG: Asp-tRNA(Asn)/Glu-tRNA(Gln) amidotransferase subunit GatB [Candidatus Altiarchaeales archaeon]|nr:Asp-tRNA(Asn)/Glu-tRNA(Gln) amidotransferase subunit GatB [Candidatus Altiarchaeales archaeon]
MSENINVKIGLEIHVPLRTEQKLFCSCRTNYYETEEPNLNTCPVCTGMPGSKPFPLNGYALETVVMIARLLECKVIDENIFVKRKHYNYPDLPSGYQRTSEPIGKEGILNGVKIWEVHLEEDPGRYDLDSGRVDYNRSGVPLIEIVTAPDMKSAEDARNFLKELVNLLKYTERIVDVGGVMRADVNISIEGGAKVEIKNINSVRGAFKAIGFEVIRQKGLMQRGGTVKQETRGFNEKSLITTSMRVKETADDYRYIPDPDIPPLQFESDFVAGIKLPETPQTRKKRIMESYGVREDYAQVMVRDKDIADLFEKLMNSKKVKAETASMWICREVLRQLNYRGIEYNECKLNEKIVSELLQLVESNAITEAVGKKLLERIIDSGESPKALVEKEKLGTVSEAGQLAEIVEFTIKENQQAVVDYKAGKPEALNYLMGSVMKKMKGRADYNVVMKLMKEKLK